MNENDKILINAYLDDELSGDEIKYIESLINSDDDANDYANKIKNANHELNSFFKSSEFDELEEGVDTFINIQLNKTKRLRNIFNIRIPRVNQKYFGFAASAMLIVIIFILVVPRHPTFVAPHPTPRNIDEIIMTSNNQMFLLVYYNNYLDHHIEAL